MTNQRRGTLYIGVTSDLLGRVRQHKGDVVPGFTRKHALHSLAYFEVHDDIREAIAREKRLKRWRRDWKIELIESQNPYWQDLYNGLRL